MLRYSRFVFLSSVILFVLLVSVARPMAVYADDGAPPPPATEEPVQPPMEESEPDGTPVEATEAPVVDEVSMTEMPVVTEEPAAAVTEVPVEEDSEEVTIGEVLEAAPEGTQVVVLDENGEALPLVSVEAAQIVQSGDPMWCPVGVTPQAGVGGCTDPGWNGVVYTNYDPTSFVDLVFNYLMNNQPNQAGVIWIERTYNSSDEAVGVTPFNMQGGAGNPFSLMSQYALTIQGGWMGDSAGTIDHAAPSTFDGNALQIINWGGNVTINDIEFLNTGAVGLLVEAQGDITLSNVDSNGNLAGADLDSGGNIDIHSSTFGAGAASGNDLLGLTTAAAGNTTLFDVTASGNGAFGAFLGDLAVFGGPITVSESHFDRNGAIGLAIFSGSSITLSEVTASDNAGAVIGLAGANLIGDGPITVSESHFDRNGFGGLLVDSGSKVSLSGVTANGNAFYGANVGAAGSVWVSHSYFDGNTDPLGEALGLGIGSDQSITLDHVSASNNEGDGAWLDAFENATVVCSQFQNNASVGVDGWNVDGTFALDDVTFGGNGMDYDGTPVFMSGGCKIVKGKGKSSSSLPFHIVPVSGGEQIELDCKSYSGTKLILPNGDRVILPCPIHDTGILTGRPADQLPAPLGAPFAFASALEVQVIRNGEVLSRVNIGMTIDFKIPDGMQGQEFTILSWDAEASQWVEVSGGTQTGDGHFMVTSSFTGIYVLVTK
ncbi:MAG TPA: right-handed parallel beta-helix repeat-containing protein [Anaerolineales bacterium]|nr:right-handed parallel beta-helix repeat-containing protein [Anaerolineales bacterium]